MDLKELLAKSRKELAKKRAERLKGSQTSSTLANTKKGKMPESVVKGLGKYGVKSFEDLCKINTSLRKYAYLGKQDLETVRQLKEDVDISVICSKIFKKPVKETQHYQNNVKFALKAFGITSGDEGFEWIPTLVSDSYIDEFNLARKVAGLFTEIKMPSNPFKWPVLTNGAISRRVAQASAISQQVFNTDETIQFDAEKLTSRYELPEELNEDSAPDIIKAIRIELMEGQEKAVEIAILEGDTAGTLHNFSQLPDVAGGTTIASISAETPETAFDGIRSRLIKAEAITAGQAAVDAGAAAVNETFLAQARSKMGKFGVDPSQLAMISGPKVYTSQLLQLDDVRTIEQYGGQATVLNGELAKYEGMPVIVSEYLREDTDATGVNSSTVPNNIKGTILMVNRKRWWTGTRRPIQIKVENNKTEFDVLDLVSFSRKAFQAVLKADATNYPTESSASMVFNIGL